jgi:hypothetical protein
MSLSATGVVEHVVCIRNEIDHVRGAFIAYAIPMILLVNPQYRYQSGGALFIFLSAMCSLRVAVALSGTLWKSVLGRTKLVVRGPQSDTPSRR